MNGNTRPTVVVGDNRMAAGNDGRIGRQRKLALVHSGVFLAAGLWPILNMRTFELVTGPKVDKWLVKTVGTLIVVTGLTGASAALRNRLTPETKGLLIGVSAALGFISFRYARRGRISRVYYLDTVLEAALIGSWLRTCLTRD